MEDFPLTRWSGLPRDLSLGNPFHRAILLLSIAAGVAGGGIAAARLGMSSVDAILRGLTVAAAVFATWVIARELDPDHPGSAFVGPPVTAVVVALAGPPGWLSVAWVGLGLRIVNRSTGLASTVLDTLLVLGLGLAVAWQQNALFLLLAALMFGLDGTLRTPRRLHRILGWVLALVGLAACVLSPPSIASVDAQVRVGLTLGVGAFLGWSWLQPAPRSVADATGEPLARARVRGGQWLAAAVVLTAWLTIGAAAVRTLSPLLAAMMGVAAYGWVVWFRARWTGGG